MKIICSVQTIDRDECYLQIFKTSERLKDKAVDGRILINLRIHETIMEIYNIG
jgi:hypothetical protein